MTPQLVMFAFVVVIGPISHGATVSARPNTVVGYCATSTVGRTPSWDRLRPVWQRSIDRASCLVF